MQKTALHTKKNQHTHTHTHTHTHERKPVTEHIRYKTTDLISKIQKPKNIACHNLELYILRRADVCVCVCVSYMEPNYTHKLHIILTNSHISHSRSLSNVRAHICTNKCQNVYGNVANECTNNGTRTRDTGGRIKIIRTATGYTHRTGNSAKTKRFLKNL